VSPPGKVICIFYFVYKDDGTLCCYPPQLSGMAQSDPNSALSNVFRLMSGDTCENDVLQGLHQLAQNGVDLNSVYTQRLAVHHGVDGGPEWVQHQHTMSHLQPMHWDGMSLSLLQAACLYKRVQAVEFLLQQKANLGYKDEVSGCTAMFYAVTIAPTGCASQNNSTVLHSVVAILRLLLEHGADLSETDRTGGTVLHHLVFSEHFQRMYDNAWCQEQDSPGLYCEILRHCFPDILCFLYENVAFRMLQLVNHVDGNGCTALMRAAHHNPWMVQPMLQQFHPVLNLCKRDPAGNTVLHVLFQPILPTQLETLQGGSDGMLLQRNLIRNCQRSEALQAILATHLDASAINARGATCFADFETELQARTVRRNTGAYAAAFQPLLLQEQQDVNRCSELLEPISTKNTRDKVLEFMSANHPLLPGHISQHIAAYALS